MPNYLCLAPCGIRLWVGNAAWACKACATLRTYCLLSLKWKESPRDVFVPSRGPSLLPLAAVQGKYCAVGGNPNPSLGPVVCECGDVVLGVFSVLWKVSRYIQVVKRKELWSWNTSFPWQQHTHCLSPWSNYLTSLWVSLLLKTRIRVSTCPHVVG